MSWESSAEYYRIVNRATRKQLGGLHSAKCVMYSVDFAEIEVLQRQHRWQEAAFLMVEAARSVERAGADFVVLCTNTMHKLADRMEKAVDIPLLHIADATAERVRSRGMRAIGLLGTRFTMEENFYRGRLAEKHGLTVMVPDAEDRKTVDRIIYEELCLGIADPVSKQSYIEIVARLVEAGAEGVILGCTEIELLIGDRDASVPLFPTTRIHAEAAVEWAISNG